MPQNRSAAKRVRQNAKRRAHHRSKKSHVRTKIKKLRATDDKDQARTLLREVKSELDRLVAKGIVHKNKAANYKRKLEKRVNAME